jgi:hypothetical protein
LIIIWPRIRCLLEGVNFILDARSFELHKRVASPRDEVVHVDEFQGSPLEVPEIKWTRQCTRCVSLFLVVRNGLTAKLCLWSSPSLRRRWRRLFDVPKLCTNDRIVLHFLRGIFFTASCKLNSLCFWSKWPALRDMTTLTMSLAWPTEFLPWRQIRLIVLPEQLNGCLASILAPLETFEWC